MYLPFLIIALFQDWENAAVSQQELSTAGKYGKAARPDGKVSGDVPDHGILQHFKLPGSISQKLQSVANFRKLF